MAKNPEPTKTISTYQLVARSRKKKVELQRLENQLRSEFFHLDAEVFPEIEARTIDLGIHGLPSVAACFGGIGVQSTGETLITFEIAKEYSVPVDVLATLLPHEVLDLVAKVKDILTDQK